jgi:AcrR family transcriptional regulator
VHNARGQTLPHHGRWIKAERRAQITSITLEIIAREGVQATTLARIAKAAGIATPSLYNHFSSRAELLEAAMDLLLDRVLEWINSSSNPNMLERLREIAGAVHKDHIETDKSWVILPLFELAAAAPAEGLTEQMGKRQLVVLQKFIDIVEEGKKQGTIREDADAQVVGWSLMGLGWTKDIALLEGLDHFITDGTAAKILDNILTLVAVDPTR